MITSGCSCSGHMELARLITNPITNQYAWIFDAARLLYWDSDQSKLHMMELENYYIQTPVPLIILCDWDIDSAHNINLGTQH
jgi:hypothetical protein